MNKRQIGRMSEQELREAVTNSYRSQGVDGARTAEELAADFLEMVFRYRRLSAMLEKELVRRVKGGRS